MKDSITADLETQVRNLQREVTANNYPIIPIQPVESTVSRVEYEKLDQELISMKKRLDGTTTEVIQMNTKNSIIRLSFRSKQKIR